MSVPHSPPAFPSSIAQVQGSVHSSMDYGLEGMTLRQWYAGRTVATIAADHIIRHGEVRPEKLAKIAFEIADALLDYEKREAAQPKIE